jgi:hypothetical protein
MKELFLIYVNVVGKTHTGKLLYEFIFSDTTKNIDGEDWDQFPAAGRPDSPHEHLVKKVGRLESDLKLDVIQNSDTFAVWDAVDGVIALAWENINAYESYPDKRLCFKFGDIIKDVETKLYEKDLILNYNTQKHEQEN